MIKNRDWGITVGKSKKEGSTKRTRRSQNRARKSRKVTFASVPQLAIIHKVETQLGLPEQFCNKLLAEDDWSFVIKLHALLEAAISHLLVETLRQPRLRSVFSRMELSNFTTGKIAFAEKLELIDKDTKRFIQKISELRNSFVHNVTNVNKTLREYFDSLDQSAVQSFRTALSWGYKTESDAMQRAQKGPKFNVDELLKAMAAVSFESSVTIAMWFGSLICLRNIYLSVETARFDDQYREFKEEIFDTLFKSKKPSPEEDASPNA